MYSDVNDAIIALQMLTKHATDSIETAINAMVQAQASSTVSATVKKQLDSSMQSLQDVMIKVTQAATAPDIASATALLNAAHDAAATTLNSLSLGTAKVPSSISSAISQVTSNSAAIKTAQNSLSTAISSLSSIDMDTLHNAAQNILDNKATLLKSSITSTITNLQSIGAPLGTKTQQFVSNLNMRNPFAQKVGGVTVQALGAASARIAVYANETSNIPTGDTYIRYKKVQGYYTGTHTHTASTKTKKGTISITSVQTHVIEEDPKHPIAQAHIPGATNTIVAYVRNPQAFPGQKNVKNIALYKYTSSQNTGAPAPRVQKATESIAPKPTQKNKSEKK